MTKTKITKVNTLAKTDYVGLYEVGYINKLGKDKTWVVASRKEVSQLNEIYLNNKQDSVDAVVIVAYHEEQNKLVLIKQFRVPINDYIYELPAGLIDNNEDIEVAVKRELKEETGLELTSINTKLSKSKTYLSPGMTDESVALVYCKCRGNLSKEYLEEDEDIQAILVSQDEAKEILQNEENIDIKAYLQLQQYAIIGDKMFL